LEEGRLYSTSFSEGRGFMIPRFSTRKKIGKCDIELERNSAVNSADLTVPTAKVWLNGHGNIQNTGTGKATTIKREGNIDVTGKSQKIEKGH
jgi:hypothetical protein